MSQKTRIEATCVSVNSLVFVPFLFLQVREFKEITTTASSFTKVYLNEKASLHALQGQRASEPTWNTRTMFSKKSILFLTFSPHTDLQTDIIFPYFMGSTTRARGAQRAPRLRKQRSVRM